ncbi:MAG: benzoate-CoA ligase family protein [Herminiimonas sp.]|nr:benzoate-CoA ligase family protein [Herminiimonas sp.]
MRELPERFNFAAHLLQRNLGNHDRLAYIDDTRRQTYGELDASVRAFAAGLIAHGVRPEERILLVMHDTIDMPVALLGALYAGVVPVPVNTLLPASDYAYMLQHCSARLAIVTAPLLPCMQEALQLSGLQTPLFVTGMPTPALQGVQSFEALLATDGQDRPPEDTHADQIAFWLYSSGSTGRPKGTVHTHANLYWTATLYGTPVLGVGRDDIVFSAAKLFFAYGLGNGLTFPLTAGATTILMAERPTPAAIFERLVRYRPTLFCGVPTLYVGMLASPDLPTRAQVALRLCASAGEALPREVGERFKAHFGADILDGLGSTEMLHIFLSNRSDDLRYGCSGKPVPGYVLELRDESGHPTPVGEIGDLYIRGPSAALLYWTAREKSRATFQGEWVKSGDKYQVDAAGFYTYAGRSDDMLKVSGQYVSPIEVEGVLMSHSSVLECAVIGHVDAEGLTRTVAYVVARAGQDTGDALAMDLKAWVKGKLAPHKYPREILFVDDLPKTATGKIQRFKLRALSDRMS